MYTIQTAKHGKVYAKLDNATYAVLAAHDAHYVTGEAIVILTHRQGEQVEFARIDPINERSSRFQRLGKKARRIDATGELAFLRSDAEPLS